MVKFQQKIMTYKQNGFTLIEMILVLGIISAVLLLAAPLQNSAIKTREEEIFIQTFKDDVLFIQNQASRYQRGIYAIRFYDDYYTITNHAPGIYATRYFPEGWGWGLDKPASKLQFKMSGNVSRPRTIVFHTDSGKILFTFPLGKGRFHVAKE